LELKDICSESLTCFETKNSQFAALNRLESANNIFKLSSHVSNTASNSNGSISSNGDDHHGIWHQTRFCAIDFGASRLDFSELSSAVSRQYLNVHHQILSCMNDLTIRCQLQTFIALFALAGTDFDMVVSMYLKYLHDVDIMMILNFDFVIFLYSLIFLLLIMNWIIGVNDGHDQLVEQIRDESFLEIDDRLSLIEYVSRKPLRMKIFGFELTKTWITSIVIATSLSMSSIAFSSYISWRLVDLR
jgi:hypothetical protein